MATLFQTLIYRLGLRLKQHLPEDLPPKRYPQSTSYRQLSNRSYRTGISNTPKDTAKNVATETGHSEQQEESKQAKEAEIELDAAQIEAEIRATRKFTLADAIGKEGSHFLKGDSTIPRPLRAANAINHFIQTHTHESAGAFSTTLQAWSCNDIRLSQQLDTPLNALSEVIASLSNEPTTFYEFARQVVIAQSQLTGDRPHFQPPNQPPHPDADYTHASIRAELTHLQQQLLHSSNI